MYEEWEGEKECGGPGGGGGIMSCAWETYIVLTINYWTLPAPFLESFNYISGQKAKHTGICHEEHKARTYDGYEWIKIKKNN
jgi:hypothetical protein